MMFLIPTLNEEKGLSSLLPKIRKEFGDIKVMIVDYCSSDKTIDVAKKYGCEVVIEKKPGKGQSVKSAVKMIDGDEDIILIDGDDTYDPVDVKKMLAYYNKKNMVIGNRLRNRKSFKILNYAGDIFLSNLLPSFLFFHKISDMLSGLRIFRCGDVKNIITKNGFELETEMTLKSLKESIKIVFVPCSYQGRKGDAKLNPFSDGWKILKETLRQRF